jgi:hypothetical protein
MTEELQTKEYLKKLEHIKLADSSRLRMREDLLAHARFHAVKEVTTPKAVPSLFFNFFMRPASLAFAMVLLVGTTAFYLNKDKTTELAVVDDTNQAIENSRTTTEDFSTAPADSKEGSETQVPTLATNTPVPDSQTDSFAAMNSRAKSAPSPESASEEMFMTSDLSAGTWSIASHQADVSKRIDGLRDLINKYDTEIEADSKTEFTTKLDTADKLKEESEGKVEPDARANLDKASVLIGEVESSLSLLGEVVVEDGFIVDVKLK